MLIHFIGGPQHGHSAAIDNPDDRIQFPAVKPRTYYMGDEFFPAEANHDVDQYRVIKRTPRYCIAEWEPERVIVRFYVELAVDRNDPSAGGALRDFILERCDDQKGDVKCVAAEARSLRSATQVTLTLTTMVDGPRDAVALQLASEKVQQYLDAELPPSVTPAAIQADAS